MELNTDSHSHLTVDTQRRFQVYVHWFGVRVALKRGLEFSDVNGTLFKNGTQHGCEFSLVY